MTAVAIASAWLALYTSQLFAIRSVEVTGTDLLVPASVEASASVPADATLLRLPADEIQARLRANPWIESVDLERRFPSTLRIVVTERVPYALVDTGSAFWSVDANGRVLGQAALDTTSGALVVIRDLQGFVPEPGSMSDADGLTNALAVLQGIDPALAGLVRGVSAPTVDETVVITAGSIEIMIGEAVQLQEKSALVTSIMAEQGQSVVFIDVRSIERPISRGLGE